MLRSIFALRAISGVLFLILLVLGIVFWTGHALALVPLHMGLGSLFVVAILTFAALSARAGAPRGPVIALVTVGVIIPIVGFAQMQLAPGASHWLIRTVHLLLGFAAMAIVGRVTVRLKGAHAGPGGHDLPGARPAV
jgi:hypothetical protein